jgi:hypothetical protein
MRKGDPMANLLVRSLSIPVAVSELIDKISILQIKSERIADPEKLCNVKRELTMLTEARDRAVAASTALNQLTNELKSINEALWDIEDQIRVHERNQDFGLRFIELARSVYHQNDRRAAVKRCINELVGSALIEEKSYESYG